LLCHDGSEHVDAADLGGIQKREGDDDHPQPGARPELPPAERELPEEVRSLDALPGRQVHAGKEDGAYDEARGIDGDRPAGPDACDDEAGRCRAADLSDVEGEPEQRICLLQLHRWDGLGDEPCRSREEEGRRCSAERL